MSDQQAGEAALLSVRDLSVAFQVGHEEVVAVDRVSLDVRAGRRIGIVGESGSGKSTLAHALLGLLDPPGRVTGGQILFDGLDLGCASESELQAVRGSKMAMIFQEALGSLNPVLTIGRQLREAIRLHQAYSHEEATERAVSLLGEVGVPSPQTRLSQYPHEFSGGMRQRVMIAMAVASNPALVIADEPTSALDVTTQMAVIALLERLTRDRNMAVLLITHDLGVIAGFVEEVLVMYGGAPIEYGLVDDIFADPRHPYTRGLIASAPGIHDVRRHRLPSIPGTLPPAGSVITGCRFRPRCYLHRGRERCVVERPALLSKGSGTAACHFQDEAAGPGDPLGALRSVGPIGAPEDPRYVHSDGSILFRAEGLTKKYSIRRLGRRATLRAVDDVSFVVRRGESVGLVGESGSGKTTVARLLLGLTMADAGTMTLDGTGLRTRRAAIDNGRRGRIQAVFQDPTDSLNPMMTVDNIVAEPLTLLPGAARATDRRRVAELLEMVGLPADYGQRRPLQLSGGQRQRVAIARALASSPALIVLDEAVSSLDVSVRAQILNLLAELRSSLDLSYLFISHDLSVVRHVCDRVIVMYEGRFVEEADVEAIFGTPQHPYTKTLLSAVPVPNPAEERSKFASRLEQMRQPSALRQ